MTRQVRTSLCHWGAFSATVEDGRLIETVPFEGSNADPAMIGALTELVYSELRIDAPMVRESFLANRESSDRSRRGQEGFVPVSWDEALDLVAAELQRVRTQYGDDSVFGGSYGWSSAGRFHHARTQVRRFLAASGGFVDQIGNYSWGAAQILLPHVLGDYSTVTGAEVDWPEIVEHTDTLVAFGGLNPKNWRVTAGGAGQHSSADWLRNARDAGVRVIVVSPNGDDAPRDLVDERISPRPNTDAAIMLALAYELINDGAHDRSFLEKYCVGFDAFRDYLMGSNDGVVRDTAWAAEIAGIPADEIKGLAHRIAAGRTLLSATWSLQRAEHGEQPFWALIALACVLGQVGLPGGGFSFGHGSINGVGAFRRRGLAPTMPGLANPVARSIPVARLTDMLLHPGESISFDGRDVVYPDVRLVYWAGGNPFHHHQDLNRLNRAWQKPETIIVHEPWWTPAARRADIVLPATTTLERSDIGGSSRDPFLFHMPRLIHPVGGSRNDFDILADLAARQGCHAAFTEDRDEAAWVRHLFDAVAVAANAQGLEPPTYEAFIAKGHWRVPPPTDVPTLFGRFRADPEGNPLSTPSGRIEIFSDTIAGFGYDDCPPHPAWCEPREWLGSETVRRWPLHLLTNQPAHQLHSQLGQVSVRRDPAFGDREPLMINTADATARGIERGDTVRVFNARGACLAAADPRDDMRAGVVCLSTGAWFDAEPDARSPSLQRRGNPNGLTNDIGTSKLAQGPSPLSALVEVEKFTAPDSGVPPLVLPPVR